MLTTEQRATLIEKFRQLPGQVESLIAGLRAEQLIARPLPKEWSAAQNVHHLFDSHANCYIRCKLIATEEHPPLKPYDQDKWADFVDGSQADVSTSLTLLKGLHTRWVSFWETLPADAWQRTGLHPDAGVLSLERMLVAYSDHGESHLRQISEVLAAQGITRNALAAVEPSAVDRSFQQKNSEETAKLKKVLAKLSDADMEKSVSHGWTIKATVVHLAFYDMRALVLLDRFDKEGISQSPYDMETINEVVHQLAAVTNGSAAVQLWANAAEALDLRIAALPDSMIAAIRAAGNPFNLPRHKHRSEHREEIEKVVGGA